jgi:hypothetical protein
VGVLEVVLGSLGLVFPAWLIWRALSTSRQLERRLAAGDPTLLNDDVQFVAVASVPVQHQGGEYRLGTHGN